MFRLLLQRYVARYWGNHSRSEGTVAALPFSMSMTPPPLNTPILKLNLPKAPVVRARPPGTPRLYPAPHKR